MREWVKIMVQGQQLSHKGKITSQSEIQSEPINDNEVTFRQNNKHYSK